MRKLFFIVVICCASSLMAQPYAGGFEHIMDVERYDDWGKGYLTIIDTHGMNFTENYMSVRNNKVLKDETGEGGFDTFTWGSELNCFRTPNGREYCMTVAPGDLVISVNGISARGWSKERFYKETEALKDGFELVFRKKYIFDDEDGNPVGVDIRDMTAFVKPKMKIQFHSPVLQNIFEDIDLTRLSTADIDYVRESNNPGVKFDFRQDNDFDFFYVKTYDFLITGNDPLGDKKLLEQVVIPCMVRDTENPDILITIAKSKDESITTTYVPVTSREVNTGSTIRSQYNYVTKRTDYIVRQNTKTVREGGYTKETMTSDLYLDISVLDAKKINDPKITYAPIVWQMVATCHLINPTYDTSEKMRIMASWAVLPREDRMLMPIGIDITELYAPLGVYVNPSDVYLVDSVKQGSLADINGIQAGDKLLEVRNLENLKKIYYQSFKKGWNYLDKGFKDCSLTIRRNGKKIKLTFIPRCLEFNRTYLAPVN